MIYGKSKARDMGRSLLPSTRAKGARDDKAAVKRATRHNIRQELQKVAYDPDYYDDCGTDFESYPDHEIREVVQERRLGDKTGPFERWSEAVTKDIEQDSRLTYVKSVLPEGIIGDHALTHIKWKDHFATQAKLQLEENIRLNSMERRKKNRGLEHDEQVAILYKIIEDGRLHRELNKFVEENASRKRPSETERTRVFNEVTREWEIKYRSVYFKLPPGARRNIRKLLGVHDIEDYLKDIRQSWRQPSIITIDGKRYANPNALEGAWHALTTFLEAVRDNKPIPRRVNNNHHLY